MRGWGWGGVGGGGQRRQERGAMLLARLSPAERRVEVTPPPFPPVAAAAAALQAPRRQHPTRCGPSMSSSQHPAKRPRTGALACPGRLSEATLLLLPKPNRRAATTSDQQLSH
jgi:hypothetical protein